MADVYIGNGEHRVNGVTREEWDSLTDDDQLTAWKERERLRKEGILIHDRTREEWEVIIQEIKEAREELAGKQGRYVVMYNCHRRRNDNALKEEWKKHPFLEGICARCVTGNGDGEYRRQWGSSDKKVVARRWKTNLDIRESYSGHGWNAVLLDSKEEKKKERGRKKERTGKEMEE